MAGLALLYGLDPLLILDCEDPLDIQIYERALRTAAKEDEVRRQDLANRIANAVLSGFQ